MLGERCWRWTKTKDVNLLYTSCLVWRDFGIDQARAGVEEHHALAVAYPAGGVQLAHGGKECGSLRADPQPAPRKLAQGEEYIGVVNRYGGPTRFTQDAQHQ